MGRRKKKYFAYILYIHTIRGTLIQLPRYFRCSFNVINLLGAILLLFRMTSHNLTLMMSYVDSNIILFHCLEINNKTNIENKFSLIVT